MNEIQQQRHDALTAHPLDAAERAVAHLLNRLPEGATPEFAAAAEMLGCRAPGETAATGTSTRTEAHIDPLRRALPRLAADKIIRFTTAVELVEGGRQHGWLAARIHDPLPGWVWHEDLSPAIAALWEQRFAYTERVLADQRVGYTAGADAVMLARHADSGGSLHGRTMVELRELTGRSRNAIERSLEILERAGYATVVRDERVRPMLHTITLHVRDEQAAAATPPAQATEAATVKPAPAAPHEVWDFTAEAAIPKGAEPVIEIAARDRLLFPEWPEQFMSRCEKYLLERFEPGVRQAIIEAAPGLEAACGWREDFVQELWQLAYDGLAVKSGRLSIFTNPDASVPYIRGIATNNGYRAKVERDAGAKTAGERAAALCAEKARAQAKHLLRRMHELVQWHTGDERNDFAEANRLLHTELLPLAPALAPLCDNDVAFAEALLRLAWKEGRELELTRDPDTHPVRDLDPEWTWPMEVQTATARQARTNQVDSWRGMFTTTLWNDQHRIKILDPYDQPVMLREDGLAEWLNTSEGTQAIRAGLAISSYSDFRAEWDYLFDTAAIDKRSFEVVCDVGASA